MEKQVTSTPSQYLEMGGGGGFWLPVFTLEPAINVDMVNRKKVNQIN